MFTCKNIGVMAILASALLATAAQAADKPQTDVEKKALEFLLTKQDENGAWMPQVGPAVTAMVAESLIRAGHKPDSTEVAKAVAFVESFRKPDGGYYRDTHVTYNTALSLNLLAALPNYDKAKLAQTQNFLKSILLIDGKTDDKGQPITSEHPWYGGAGYAGTGAKRPDLSNTHFTMEALRNSGVPANDPAIQAMLKFVSRCQANSETNDQDWAKGQNSGGFIYSTRYNDKLKMYGESMAPNSTDRQGNEVLTTYGSMTYAGLKSFLYAGLKPEDPRVKAALSWIQQNWTLESNPGMGSQQGLFYYYHTYAKALTALGRDTLQDAKGVNHDWRKELVDALTRRQKPDGSFVNTAEERWMEGNPVLATTYVVMALTEARK